MLFCICTSSFALCLPCITMRQHRIYAIILGLRSIVHFTHHYPSQYQEFIRRHSVPRQPSGLDFLTIKSVTGGGVLAYRSLFLVRNSRFLGLLDPRYRSLWSLIDNNANLFFLLGPRAVCNNSRFWRISRVPDTRHGTRVLAGQRFSSSPNFFRIYN